MTINQINQTPEIMKQASECIKSSHRVGELIEQLCIEMRDSYGRTAKLLRGEKA